MTKLTDSQMIVLSGAAQREDGAAILPEAMKPASLAKLLQALIAQELVREVRTKSKMPIWRRDAAGRPPEPRDHAGRESSNCKQGSRRGKNLRKRFGKAQ